MTPTTFMASGQVPVETAEGATLAPGETTDNFDPAMGRNSRLVDAGRMVACADRKGPTKADLLEQAAELDVKGRTKMTRTQLEATVKAAQNPDQPAGDGENGDN